MPPSSPCYRLLRLSFGQVVAQNESTVVVGVVCAVEQRHSATPSGLKDRLPTAGFRVELVSVSTPKLLPALLPMVKPFPELRTGCDILHPRVGRNGSLCHTSRPEALDKDSSAVAARWTVVGALDAKHVSFLSDLEERLLTRQNTPNNLLIR